MVSGLAYLATAIAGLFAESTFVRWSQRRSPQLGIWSVALAMFTVAAATLALGVSTGWDEVTFRLFYLLGAVLNVPWLALGTAALLLGPERARRIRWFLVFFSGLAAGVLLSAPMEAVSGAEIPVGQDVFGTFPRVLAAVGSGVGATVIFAGAVWSALRFARDRTTPDHARRAGANALIAAGTLLLSSGGLVQGVLGHDTAFVTTLTVGIAVVYAGFLVADGGRPSEAETLTRE